MAVYSEKPNKMARWKIVLIEDVRPIQIYMDLELNGNPTWRYAETKDLLAPELKPAPQESRRLAPQILAPVMSELVESEPSINRRKERSPEPDRRRQNSPERHRHRERSQERRRERSHSRSRSRAREVITPKAWVAARLNAVRPLMDSDYPATAHIITE